MMGLGDDRHPIVTKALDHPNLPQWLRSVERDLGDPCHQGLEFVGLTGGSQAHHVIPDVEVADLHPGRLVEAEGGLDEALAKRSQLREPFFEALENALVAEVTATPNVQDQGPEDVHRGAGGLGLQKDRVQTRKMLHGSGSSLDSKSKRRAKLERGVLRAASAGLLRFAAGAGRAAYWPGSSSASSVVG